MQNIIIGAALLASVAACSANYFHHRVQVPDAAMVRSSAPEAAKPNCVEGDCFESAVRIGDNQVPLRGQAIFRVLNNNIYTSAFYVPFEAKTTMDVLGEVPKRLVIHCLRDFKKEDILKALEKTLRSNPTLDVENLAPGIDTLSEHMDMVRQGDEYALTYLPGLGTQFEFNGQIRVIIPGSDFAKALFGIWVSPYSMNQKMRLQLLSFQR